MATDAPYAHPQHLKVLKHFAYIQYGCGMLPMRVFSLTMTLQHHTGRENLHHMDMVWSKRQKIYIIIGYYCEVTVYSFQLDKELHIVHMNTLKLGYTSKAHCFTSQIIVSQM